MISYIFKLMLKYRIVQKIRTHSMYFLPEIPPRFRQLLPFPPMRRIKVKNVTEIIAYRSV